MLITGIFQKIENTTKHFFRLYWNKWSKRALTTTNGNLTPAKSDFAGTLVGGQ